MEFFAKFWYHDTETKNLNWFFSCAIKEQGHNGSNSGVIVLYSTIKHDDVLVG